MHNKVEDIKPYDEQGNKTEQVRRMFDSIAPAYDFMNRAMTLGIDKWWRRVARRKLSRYHPQHILDVATGTGDFAIDLYRNLSPKSLTGIDLSENMLEVARTKAEKLRLPTEAVTFEMGDCLRLPYDDNVFDAVTVAFGVRNFENLEQGYRQMHRVLKSGGVICVIELSTPTIGPVRFLYDLYTMHIIPFVGSLKSGDKSAYRYLPESIAAVPQGDDMLAIMRKAGFVDTQAKRLTLGTCTIYLATKP